MADRSAITFEPSNIHEMLGVRGDPLGRLALSPTSRFSAVRW